MHKFYKVTWGVVFTLLYPFITLFSLVFIGIVSAISSLSRLITTPFQKKAATGYDVQHREEWEAVATNGELSMSSKAVQEIQFGPTIYQLKASAKKHTILQGYWSDFIVPFGPGFLLQRWPSIEEHRLEFFELVYFHSGLQEPVVLHTMPTFYWQVIRKGQDAVEVVWEEEEEKRHYISVSQLP